MGPLWPPITGYRRRSLKFGNGRPELCRPAGTRCKPQWSREALSCATPNQLRRSSIVTPAPIGANQAEALIAAE